MENVQERGWFAMGPMNEDERRRAEAVRLGVPFITLGRGDIAIESLVLIPEPLSRTANIVAYRHTDEGIEVALLDLADLPQIDFLRQTHRVQVRLTDRGSIKQALLLYQKHLKEKFAGMVQGSKEAAEALLKHALHSGAQYVHLEPAFAESAGMVVRYRIKGALREAMRLPEEASRYIVERLKLLGRLFPVATAVQEGSFTFDHDGEDIGVALTAVPTANGEKLTMRLSRSAKGVAGFSLQTLGLHGEALELVHDALHAQKGLLLIAGMSQSGKTTLLYTMLDHITTARNSVATVEEKVEHRLPRVHQTATRPDLGLIVPAALRAVLKQDPDAVMVSDLSASGAAEIALKAAERGVFVLGGISARSAEGALDELLAGGVERDLVLKNVCLVVAERLVRKLGPNAKVRPLTREEAQLFEGRVSFAKILAALKAEGVVHEHTAWREVVFYTAKDANEYAGLVGIQEILPVARGGQAMPLNLLEDALFKAVQGQTSIEEATQMAEQ